MGHIFGCFFCFFYYLFRAPPAQKSCPKTFQLKNFLWGALWQVNFLFSAPTVSFLYKRLKVFSYLLIDRLAHVLRFSARRGPAAQRGRAVLAEHRRRFRALPATQKPISRGEKKHTDAAMCSSIFLDFRGRRESNTKINKHLEHIAVSF